MYNYNTQAQFIIVQGSKYYILTFLYVLYNIMNEKYLCYKQLCEYRVFLLLLFFLIVPKYNFMFYKSMIGNYMRWLMYKIMWGVEGIQL